MKKSFLASILMLNARQEERLKLYLLAHKNEVDPLRKRLKALMIALQTLRNKPSFSIMLEENVNKEIAGIIGQIQVENTKYLNKVRLMCSVEKQKYFDEIASYKK